MEWLLSDSAPWWQTRNKTFKKTKKTRWDTLTLSPASPLGPISPSSPCKGGSSEDNVVILIAETMK